MTDENGQDDDAPRKTPRRPTPDAAPAPPESRPAPPAPRAPSRRQDADRDPSDRTDEPLEHTPFAPRDPFAPVQMPTPPDWPPPQDAPDAPAPMGPPLGAPPLPDIGPIRRKTRVPTRQPAEAVPPPPPPSQPPTPPLSRAPEARETPRRPRKPLWRRLAVGVVQAVILFVLLSLLWVAAYRFIPPPITATMIGDVVAGHGVTKRWRPLSRIDPNMARAAIGAEDSSFCTHNGFDLAAIEAAYKRNQKGGRIRGGSTISQQTAKNVFLWQGGGYFRKALEAYYTVLIETIWGKRRIMEVYLNVAETGIGTYGVEAGARRYFKHGADRLTPHEAAAIAAVLPLPKKRAAVDPRGFTRRYGASIRSRIGTVRAQGLDACLR